MYFLQKQFYVCVIGLDVHPVVHPCGAPLRCTPVVQCPWPAGDGRESIQPLNHSTIQPGTCRLQAMAEMDGDGNGDVDLGEFTSWCAPMPCHAIQSRY